MLWAAVTVTMGPAPTSTQWSATTQRRMNGRICLQCTGAEGPPVSLPSMAASMLSVDTTRVNGCVACSISGTLSMLLDMLVLL